MKNSKNAVASATTKAPVSLMDITVEAVKRAIFLLAGIHLCRIKDVIPQRPKNDKYGDHIQLGVVFVNEQGQQHTEFLATRGFVKYKELSQDQLNSGLYENRDGWAVEIASGQRIEDPAKTLQTQSRLGGIMADAGLTGNHKPSALQGRTIGIKLVYDAEYDNIKLQDTMTAEAATKKLAVANDVM